MCDCVDKLSDSNLCGRLPGTPSDTFCQGKTQQFYADPCDCTKYVQCSNHNTFLQSCGSGTMWSQSSLACVAGSCSAASPQTPGLRGWYCLLSSGREAGDFVDWRRCCQLWLVQACLLNAHALPDVCFSVNVCCFQHLTHSSAEASKSASSKLH